MEIISFSLCFKRRSSGGQSCLFLLLTLFAHLIFMYEIQDLLFRVVHKITDYRFRVTSHYSKSQIFVQKFNFNKIPIFSPKFFWQFFSWNQSCHQLKSPKPQHFHEFFTQKNRQISREIKKWSYFGYFYQRAIFLKESLLYFFAPDIFILQKGVVVFSYFFQPHF